MAIASKIFEPDKLCGDVAISIASKYRYLVVPSTGKYYFRRIEWFLLCHEDSKLLDFYLEVKNG